MSHLKTNIPITTSVYAVKTFYETRPVSPPPLFPLPLQSAGPSRSWPRPAYQLKAARAPAGS